MDHNRDCSDEVEDFRFAHESEVATASLRIVAVMPYSHVHTLPEYCDRLGMPMLVDYQMGGTLKFGTRSPLPVSISMLSARATGSVRSAVTARLTLDSCSERAIGTLAPPTLGVLTPSED
jgi:hypothetical protein